MRLREVILLSLLLSGGVLGSDLKYLGTKQPYQYEKIEVRVPEGYKPFFINHLGRHGSRHLSSAKYDKSIYELLDMAEKRTTYKLQDVGGIGEVKIADEVVAIIAALAATDSQSRPVDLAKSSPVVPQPGRRGT